MRPLLRLACALVLSLGLAAPALADETGSISGTIFDSGGAVVADATVTVRGELLPAGRTVTTGQNGQYRFLRLLPGTYVVEVEKTGLGRASRPVIVELDKDTQVELVLGVQVQETLEVVGAITPVVDLKSTEVNFNFKADQIQDLPLVRSYAGLFQLVPGVADNNSFAPNGGGSRQDNTYLIDGVNITNPGFGYLSTEVNEFDIEEFNIKRGAITAEFGRSSGFVTNAVTRSGSNTLRGAFRFEMIPKSWVAEPKDPTLRETADRWVPAFYVGGPLVRDKVFWYGSGRFARASTTGRVNRVGPVPDRKDRTDEWFGKITAQPTPNHSINVGYRHRPTTVDYAGIGNNDSPEVATNTEGTNKIASASWAWFATARSVVDVKYVHMTEANESVAITDLGFRPTWNPNDLAAMGYFYDSSRDAYVGGATYRLDQSNYTRDEIKGTYTQFLDLGSTSHQIKAGFGLEESKEDLTRLSNGWGNISVVQGGAQVNANYYPEQPSQISPARTYSLFVQDDITIGTRWTVNAGLLVNRDEFAQTIDTRNTFLAFNFGQELQPRLGVNYQVRKDVGDKAYANYGRYYNLDMKSSSRALAPLRLYTNDATFDATGNLLSDVPRASTTGKVIAPGIDPPYIDEFLVGYATPLAGTWSLDVFFMYRNANNFIEDFPRTLPSSDFIYDNVPDAKRKYRALTFELSRRLADRWSLSASYSYSRLWGNFDLDYSTGAIFNTSSALQDGPGLFVEDEYRYGPLSQDRTHVFKAFATWLPTDRLTLGGYLRVQSGTPWEARGRDWYNGYRRYLEQAGTNRNDVWPNFDLLASYKLPLGARASAGIEARVLNLFDTQTALSRDNRKYLDGRIRDFANPPYLIQGTTQPNPDYGQPTDYAPPRRLLLTVFVNF